MNAEKAEDQENGENHEKEPKISSSSSPRGVLETHHLSVSSDFGSSSFGSPAPAEESPGGGRRGLSWKQWFDQIKKRKNRKKKVLGRIRSSEESKIDSCHLQIPKPSWKNFTFEELAQATDNFSPDKLIGQGGHAQVYKGCLADGQVVAVKRITKKDKNDDDRVGDFLSELGIIAHINHPNAVKLIGFSADGGFHLVLQYLPHGSLASVLHGSEECLEWRIRFKVAIGIAEGLHYLHWDCTKRIIHRDITASNILLTEDYEPQISDFGLAKWLPAKWSRHVVSPIEGTFGYQIS